MTLCGFEIAPGEKRHVKLPVPGGEPLEAWLLCGIHPGKTLVVTAGVHGCEYVGILALQKLVETLDCATLYGQVILLPLVNSKGFFAGIKQLNPADDRNLNREFPGREDGTETQRMAWAIEKLLYPEADFLLDLHGGDWNEELAPLVFFPCGAGQTVEQETRRAAQALSVSMRVCSTARNGLYSWAAQKRNPCFAVGARRKWPLDSRRGGCRLRRCTPSDEPSWNKKRSVRCCSANRNCKSRLRRSSGGWLLVSGSLCWAGSIKGCTAGQVEKLRWDAELRGPCKICGADFV